MKILKIQTLEKGWCDRDHIMLHAAYDLALKRHWRVGAMRDEEDQRNLHRLVNIRQFLWT
jgi:hypothetical protein